MSDLINEAQSMRAPVGDQAESCAWSHYLSAADRYEKPREPRIISLSRSNSVAIESGHSTNGSLARACFTDAKKHVASCMTEART